MLSRRDVLRSGVVVTSSAAARRLLPVAPVAGTRFPHGVASGDPTSDGVVLWTRVDGEPGEVPVRWVVARDEALRDVVRSGETTASPDADHTVHVDVDGLAAATTWHYGFEARGERSPTGRTRTAAGADDPAEIRLGVVSCASYAAGPFTAYRHLAETDVDLVLHLGDYLYDAGTGPRRHEPAADPVTLEDYRLRHAQQRSDPDLQALHAAAPMVAIWDDHDVAGNAWRGGAPNHDDEHGPWEQRRSGGLQAWREWLPVRLPDPDRPERIWRRLRLGGVADLVLLDTRHDGRDRQLDESSAGRLDDPERSLLSDEQRRWLADTLAASDAPWRVLANQVVFTPLAFTVPDFLAGVAGGLGMGVDGTIVNPDAWDGYPAERDRVLAALAAAGPTVILTGDVHSSWAFEVAGADGRPLTVEWVVPSVTSPPFADVVGLPAPSLAGVVVDRLARQLPHIRWADITEHGYLVVAISPSHAQGDWWHVDLDRGDARLAASWAVERSAPVLVQAAPLPPRAPVSSTTTATTERPAPAGDDGRGATAGDRRVSSGALAGLGALAAGAAALAVGVRRRRGR